MQHIRRDYVGSRASAAFHQLPRELTLLITDAMVSDDECPCHFRVLLAWFTVTHANNALFAQAEIRVGYMLTTLRQYRALAYRLTHPVNEHGSRRWAWCRADFIWRTPRRVVDENTVRVAEVHRMIERLHLPSKHTLRGIGKHDKIQDPLVFICASARARASGFAKRFLTCVITRELSEGRPATDADAERRSFTQLNAWMRDVQRQHFSGGHYWCIAGGYALEQVRTKYVAHDIDIFLCSYNLPRALLGKWAASEIELRPSNPRLIHVETERRVRVDINRGGHPIQFVYTDGDRSAAMESLSSSCSLDAWENAQAANVFSHFDMAQCCFLLRPASCSSRGPLVFTTPLALYALHHGLIMLLDNANPGNVQDYRVARYVEKGFRLDHTRSHDAVDTSYWKSRTMSEERSVEKLIAECLGGDTLHDEAIYVDGYLFNRECLDEKYMKAWQQLGRMLAPRAKRVVNK
jgi:hypothetical protein